MSKRPDRIFSQVESEEEAWRRQARVVLLTVVSAGLRRGEILGLRWRDVSLADPAGAHGGELKDSAKAPL